MPHTKPLNTLAINTIRGLSMDAVQAANSGHPGTPMALAPLGWAIFSKLRKHNPQQPNWPDRDRFVLSCGHASMLQYALLHLSGYALSLDDIQHFRQWNSLTPGHPEVHHTPGVETTTGPLGQGIANGVGMAMAERALAARFNRPGHTLIDHTTWVIASDGDVMEGVASEAASLAGHQKLGKLIVFWDDNAITIDGRTDLTFTEDVSARFAAYGWQTLSVNDGDNINTIIDAAKKAQQDPRPSFVRVKTIIGTPAPNKKDTSSAHGAPLGEEEIRATKKIMDWPETSFYVPEELHQATKQIQTQGAEQHQQWQATLTAYRDAFPEEAADFERALAGELPKGWDTHLPVFDADTKGLATRKASGAVLSALGEHIDELFGGSADLAGSNNCTLKSKPWFGDELNADFVPGQSPRNMAWGVREHAMGSAINGMALHGGFIPYAATFLIFSDYMRPALRMAALMNLPTRYIFTHDSIGLGEDGPTHQPIEQLASLRAIPGFLVLRPADANETRECWRAAIQWKGPAALVLTRQHLPTLDRTEGHHNPADGVAKGAYILKDAVNNPQTPQAILLASGSEVHIALDAQTKLLAEGIHARVVSMPSWELFAQQDRAYRDHVLPPTVTARTVIEAGVQQGWERWAGHEGAFITLDRFGASAPYQTLYQKLGITAERAVEETKKLLA